MRHLAISRYHWFSGRMSAEFNVGPIMNPEDLRRKRQLNVQEQNALRKQAIVEFTCQMCDPNGTYAWLAHLLVSKTALTTRGVLVDVGSTPEQEGEFVSGLWLSEGQRFFEFEVMLPWQNEANPIVERWEEVTQQTETSEHVPGTGKTSGFLALEILREYERPN